MTNVHVTSFTELHQALERCRDNSPWIFRGQSNPLWKLVPKAGRPPFDRIEDDALVEDWKSNAIQYLATKPRTELEWLAVAQHHGLATRLLDWSHNPLIAAFFAIWEEGPTDAALFAFRCCHRLAANYDGDPFDSDTDPSDRQENVFTWAPDAISSRIARQQGIFTVHQPARTPLYVVNEYEELMCIRIDRCYRTRLREELSYYGITRASLFPDLDGLANHLNWKIHLDYQDVEPLGQPVSAFKHPTG